MTNPAPAGTQEVKVTPEERFEVELPKDLAPSPETPEPSPEAAALPAQEVEPKEELKEEPKEAKPQPMVPKAALDEERGKRKRMTADYERVEAARQQYEQDLAKAREELRKKKTAEPIDYNQLTDLNEAAAKLKEEIRASFQDEIETLKETNLRTRVILSERYFMREHPDYLETLTKSGVADAIKLDANGRPADPFLYQYIYTSNDPAETTYLYAKGKIAGVSEAEAETRGIEKGKQEVVDKIINNAEKPTGIAGLPSSSNNRPGYTREDIDNMTDGQKKWIQTHRPEVWRAYLGG